MWGLAVNERVRVTDHALVRFLERAGGIDFEPLRDAIGNSLERSLEAARRLGATKVDIVIDGHVFIVRDGHLLTMRPVKRR